MNPLKAGLAEHFLLDQFPLKHRALIPAALRNARASAAALAKAEPILQVASAEDNHGRIISYAVDLAIERLIHSGRWPVDYRWRHFAKPTGRYLEVRFSHSVMTVSQVAEPKVQPRDVRFRHNARLNNQETLALPEFNDTRSAAGGPAFLLVHGRTVRGDMQSEFAHVGLPHPNHRRDYIYQTPNLMNMIQVMDSDLPPVEDTDAEAVLSIKVEIEKWRRDNGSE